VVRRAVLRLAAAAGIAPPVIALLEGTTHALARSEETDFAVLYAALALEHEAIALYGVGLRRNLFPTNLRHYAVEFRGDHEGHRDTQIAIAEERGGRPPVPRDDYDFGPVEAGDEFVRKALLIEVAAQEAYTTLLSQIGTRDYMLSAAFILIDEVRHMTVWRRVLGLRIY
jgi:hypothetical protein